MNTNRTVFGAIRISGGSAVSVRTVLLPLDGTQPNTNLAQLVRTHINPDGVRLVLMRAFYLGSVADANNDKFQAGNAPLPAEESEYKSGDVPNAQSDPVHHEMLCRLQDELSEQVESLRSAGYTVIGEIRFGTIAKHVVDYVNTKSVSMIAVISEAPYNGGTSPNDPIVESIMRDVHLPVLVIRLSDMV